MRLSPARRTARYAEALGLARLILLRYCPDLRGGDEHVLALPFDMNRLFEEYVAQALRRAAPPDVCVHAQRSRPFWPAGAELAAGRGLVSPIPAWYKADPAAGRTTTIE